MHAGLFLMIIPVLLAWNAAGQPNDYQKKVRDYINRYKSAAINEMKLFRIPASITLAQGIVETAAGTSALAREANNHFGIKCHKDWKGMTYIQDDDTKDECFRKYADPLESYRDHSHFLTRRERYASLFKLSPTDYKGWARGLKSAGYATNPKYPEMLIRVIETHELFLLDRITASAGIPDTLVVTESVLGQETIHGFKLLSRHPAGRDIFLNNRRKLIIAMSDDNIYQIARDFNLSVEKLLTHNDLAFATSLKPGQIVYLEKKRRKASVKEHVFREGERLYDIVQQYGIQLNMIYKRNDFGRRPEPVPGMVLKLR